MFEVIDNYNYVSLFNANTHPHGFKNIILAGNNSCDFENIDSSKTYGVFIGYDYKNNIESVLKKVTDRPLNFPGYLLFEAEYKADLNDVGFSVRDSYSLSANDICPLISKETYIHTINKLKHHIQLGDVYELNFCISYSLKTTINPFELYLKLNAISHAPFSAFSKINNQYIISSSPERFLKKEGNTLLTQPIKGTAKRSSDNLEDERIKTDLHNSLKERTENVMIVDVARNDLSRIAKKGSVLVNKLYDVESYEQVHQMVSTVSCEIKPSTSFKEIIHATFPMASMTGAPKIRAMELIDEYECINRGPYSGTLGYLLPNGDFDLNVLIRSIFYNADTNELSFTVGSAITHLCNAEEEYEECLLKAQALIKALCS